VRQKSRIDYIFVSEHFEKQNFFLNFLGLDHAGLVARLTCNDNQNKRNIKLKDWVLTTDEFLTKGRKVILETIIDHETNNETRQRLRHRQRHDDNMTPKDIEKELVIFDTKEGITHSHVLMVIISRISALQRRIQTEMTRLRGKRLKGLKDKLDELMTRKHTLQDNDEQMTDVLDNIEKTIQDIKNDSETIDNACRTRIRNFEQDQTGKNNAYTFSILRDRKSKRQINKIIEDGVEYDKTADIMTRLAQKYQKIVGQEYKDSMDIHEFMRKYDISLGESQHPDDMDDDFTVDDIKNAIRQAAKKAAPGPTGHTTALYAFIFSEIPEIFTKAINELIFVPGLSKSQIFQWIRFRHIIYIPKPNKDHTKIENLRPLSMLESFYKIMTRVMAYRLLENMKDTCDENQHGFIAGKSCHTALLPVVAGAEDAVKNGKALQLLAVDISSAFDTIHPPLIKEVMLLQKIPEKFSTALHDMTTGGRAAVSFNGHTGPEFMVKTGSGQGDPPSAPRFTTGTEPLTRALQKVSREFRYTYHGIKLPISVYADDNMLPLQIRNIQDLQNIFDVLNDFFKVSGLKVNLAKTEMLAYNTDPDLLKEIKDNYGIKIVESLTYLGIELTGGFVETRAASYQKIKQKIEARCEKIQLSFTSMLHRKQMINQAVTPMINHIAMCLGSDSKFNEDIDLIINRTLWTKNRKGVKKMGRRMVARGRTDMSFSMGGLDIERTADAVDRLLLNSLQRLIPADYDKADFHHRFIRNELVRNGFLQLEEMIKLGPMEWDKIKDSVLVTPMLKEMAGAYGRLLRLNENDKEGWLSSSIIGHSQGGKCGVVSRADGIVLEQGGIEIIADLFGHQENNLSLDLKKNRDFSNIQCNNRTVLLSKLKKLRKNFENMNQSRVKPIAFYKVLATTKFSRIFKKLKKKTIDAKIRGPPSYFTRLKQGVMLPTLHEYKKGYEAVFKADIPVRTREVSFNILNRQIWTEQKIFWAARGGEADQTCKLCGDIENTEHLIFGCQEYSMIIWEQFQKIGDYIVKKLDPGKSFVISIHNVMYSVPFSGIDPKIAKIMFHLSAEIKRDIIYRKFRRSMEPRLNEIIYNDQRVRQHIQIIAQKILSLKSYQGKSTKPVHDILEAIAYMDGDI
jgi:hypothetical protein